METSGIYHKKNGIGAAFDIGTTTVAGACVDLSTGRVLGQASVENPQARWGRDVVSRLEAIQREPGLLKEMSASLADACNEITRGLAGGKPVTEITAAGNPLMEHILLGISPEPLSRVPYRPAFKKAQRLPAGETGLLADAGAGIYAFPLIGGFVGGDAVAVALSLGLRNEKEPALAIDIGTNSEIMLSSGSELYATSAAAGPAFEGGEVSSGMVAGPGAIEGVAVEKDSVRLDVIGNVAPKGICGSGLIEAVSGLLKAGVIEPSGRIRGRDEVQDNLSGRITEGPDGNSFLLYRGARGEVVLTQQDIRALQTAKAATRAGVEMLLKKAGLKAGDVRKVYVAGAFGSHLKPASLAAIGLLDRAWLNSVQSVGDAALNGALLALSDEKKAEAEALAESFKYVPLSGSAHFEGEFIRRMNF
ncbi:MAG: ASKHA domain-containing protein [Deltaproteobacteria bacterium]|nr:ASKHA domain-containing protein [Deltaproteobacteria bacterium]